MTHPPRYLVRLRAAVPTAFLAAGLLGAAPAAAETSHHAHHGASAPAEAASSPTPTAAKPAAVAKPAASSMWEVSTASDPSVAKGAPGPLWSSYTPIPAGQTSMGRTFAERYIATQLAAASNAPTLAERAAAQAAAARLELTKSQATKKLTKKCQKLVKLTKAKDLKKLKKADKKARTKCLEQRRKLIEDSKKKPETKPGSGTNPSTNPGSSNPGTNPGSSDPGTNPGANPGGGDPKPNDPAPTTPDKPNPTTPTQPACTPGTGTVRVEGVAEGAKYKLSYGSTGVCLKAGSINFRLVVTDQTEPHNLFIVNKVDSAGKVPEDAVVKPIVPDLTEVDEEGNPGEATGTATGITAGTWYLVCQVPGHELMTIAVTVVA